MLRVDETNVSITDIPVRTSVRVEPPSNNLYRFSTVMAFSVSTPTILLVFGASRLPFIDTPHGHSFVIINVLVMTMWWIDYCLKVYLQSKRIWDILHLTSSLAVCLFMEYLILYLTWKNSLGILWPVLSGIVIAVFAFRAILRLTERDVIVIHTRTIVDEEVVAENISGYAREEGLMEGCFRR